VAMYLWSSIDFVTTGNTLAFAVQVTEVRNS